MKGIKKIFNWFGIALICRWSIWLIAFIPAVHKAWYGLISTPETGPQIHEIVARIGENPVWQLIFDQVLGVPGACVFLVICFLKRLFVFLGGGIYALIRLAERATTFIRTIFNLPFAKWNKRYYLRLIEENGEEYFFDLENGLEVDPKESRAENLRRTRLPSDWGEVIFEMDLKKAAFKTADRKEVLNPHRECILERRDGTSETSNAVLIYCPTQINWPE